MSNAKRRHRRRTRRRRSTEWWHVMAHGRLVLFPARLRRLRHNRWFLAAVEARVMDLTDAEASA